MSILCTFPKLTNNKKLTKHQEKVRMVTFCQTVTLTRTTTKATQNYLLPVVVQSRTSRLKRRSADALGARAAAAKAAEIWYYYRVAWMKSVNN